MAVNPMHVLKRKLEDENTPLTKRLCLAKNVIKSPNFPALTKERVVGEWLESNINTNTLCKEDFFNVLLWINDSDDLTAELKIKLIQITSHYVKKKQIEKDDIPHIIMFLENEKIHPQLHSQTSEFTLIIKLLLENLKESMDNNLSEAKKVFTLLQNYYKDSKRKLEVTSKIIKKGFLETIFQYLDIPSTKETVLKVLQSTLFPASKKSFYTQLVRTMMQKESLDKLIAEKGDSIQTVLQVMDVIFASKEIQSRSFIEKFIEVFVSSYKEESQLIFAFYILIGSALNIEQTYINPCMEIPRITFEDNSEKTKRSIFNRMIEILIENEIDIYVRLTDTLGTASKSETKKNFSTYLQTVMMSLLKLEGKPDKNTIQIIKKCLHLDPSLVEEKLNEILPPLLAAKKSHSIFESYTDMLNYLLETLFKLSRGTIFINKILPKLKIYLENSNTEQASLQRKVNRSLLDGMDCEKQQNKMLIGNDVFPQESVDLYGRLASELMSRQNCELLLSLKNDFESTCLATLEDGNVEPSAITLTETLSAILSSYFARNKMADHTVPVGIAEEFWAIFAAFEKDVLKKFGKCLAKCEYNPRLTTSFIKLCTSYAELKILNVQYSSQKLTVNEGSSTHVFDLSPFLPCLNSKKWIGICSSVNDYEGVLLLDRLMSLKMVASQLSVNEDVSDTKTHLIQEIEANPNILNGNTELLNVLVPDLDAEQANKLSKVLINELISNPDSQILNNDTIFNNKMMLNSLAFETLTNAVELVENTKNLPSLLKSMRKSNFSIQKHLENIANVPEYFENFALKESEKDVLHRISLLEKLKICYADENTQLTAIFLALAIKHKTDSKKLQKSVDGLLLNIFELSPKYPDLFKLFPIEYILDFDKETFLNLLTLKIKTSNQLLPVKCILETAVKKVKTNSEVVKIAVKILLSHQKVKKEDTRNIEYFSDKVFLISCIALPIIAKEKRAITTSNFRSILAELQEKLHKSLLKSFKSINFENERSILMQDSGMPDDSSVISENMLATLNAMEAFSLTLSKYCESTDAEEIQHLDCLWNGLEYFVQNAITSIQNIETKNQHVDSSIQLLNVVLRYIKKLESHKIFQNKDQICHEIWKSVKARLYLIFDRKLKKNKKYVSDACLDEIAVTLKFVSELATLECFTRNFAGDLFALMVPKKQILKENDHSIIASQQVAKFIWSACLKANIVGPKCISLSKIIYRTCKNLALWIRQHYEISTYNSKDLVTKVFLVNVEESVCDLLKINLDVVSEVTLAAKKIPLDYKFMDAIFELQHMMHFIIGRNTCGISCILPWRCYCDLFEGCLSILNSLAMSREELLEDRWPNYMQCYRALVVSLCQKSSTQDEITKETEDKLAELAHAIEKLTQSISKKKNHISRLAAYTIADICCQIEKTSPTRAVRQHLENSVALLIQAADSNYAMAFLRRALVGHPGQTTMTNLYTMYKRYHKYVGNA